MSYDLIYDGKTMQLDKTFKKNFKPLPELENIKHAEYKNNEIVVLKNEHQTTEYNYISLGKHYNNQWFWYWSVENVLHEYKLSTIKELRSTIKKWKKFMEKNIENIKKDEFEIYFYFVTNDIFILSKQNIEKLLLLTTFLFNLKGVIKVNNNDITEYIGIIK